MITGTFPLHMRESARDQGSQANAAVAAVTHAL